MISGRNSTPASPVHYLSGRTLLGLLMTTAELADRDQLAGVLAALNVDPLRLLDVTLDLVADVSASELTDTQLARGVVKLRRRMDRADALFAEWTLAAHQRGACTVDSYKSTKSWLKWKTGMHPGHVQRAIDTASLTELLPDIGAGWRDGTISSAAVETIAAARVAGHDEKLQALEPEFLDLARRGTTRASADPPHISKLTPKPTEPRPSNPTAFTSPKSSTTAPNSPARSMASPPKPSPPR